METLEQLIQRIEHDGTITESELRTLHQHIMWDGQISQAEKDMFKALLGKIKTRQLKFDKPQPPPDHVKPPPPDPNVSPSDVTVCVAPPGNAENRPAANAPA